MKMLDILALMITTAILYIACVMSGLWWVLGRSPLISGYAMLFAFAIAYERGYKCYWRNGNKKIFLFVYAIPLIFGLLGFAYGFYVNAK
jgi:hypothetical protein